MVTLILIDFIDVVLWILFHFSPDYKNLIRFNEFGGAIHQRPVQDLAFAVARFVQKGGSFVNYYMVSSLISLIHAWLSLSEIYPMHSSTEAPTLGARLEVRSLRPATTMMPQLMNMVLMHRLIYVVFVFSIVDLNSRVDSRPQVRSSEGAPQGD